MSNIIKITINKVILLMGLLMVSVSVGSISVAAEPDWSTIEGVEVTAFYPGVASWDFLLSEDHGSGAKAVKAGKKSCADCHTNKKGELDILADDIVLGDLTMSASDKPFEPNPHKGLSGFKRVNVQAAFDDENIYVRLSWPSAGKSFNDAGLAEKDMADKVSVQLANKIKSFANFGCYMTCHDDQIDMPGYRGNKQTLYTYYSHSKGKLKPQEKLDGYLAKGQFVDLWVAEFHGAEIKASDEYILQARNHDQEDLQASGSFADNQYSVVFKRKLDTASEGDIAISSGSIVNIAIAIHDEASDSRVHYTSFPLTVGLDAPAELTATKL